MRPLADTLREKRAALFDLDGTLVDSIGVWNETDRILHRELTGAEADAAALQRLRDGALRQFRNEADPYLCYCGVLARRYGTALTPAQVHARRSDISRSLLESAVDYKPGADRLLLALKRMGHILVLATTGRRSSLDVYRSKNRNIIEKAPIDRVFDRVYTCEDVANIKPDPEIYLRAMADMSLAPDECLVFEDSLDGVRAAKAAGLAVAAVYDRHAGPDRAVIDALADWRVSDYPALLAALATT